MKLTIITIMIHPTVGSDSPKSKSSARHFKINRSMLDIVGRAWHGDNGSLWLASIT